MIGHGGEKGKTFEDVDETFNRALFRSTPDRRWLIPAMTDGRLSASKCLPGRGVLIINIDTLVARKEY